MRSKYTFLIWILLSSLFTDAQTVQVMSYNIRLDVESDGENKWDMRKEKLASLMSYYAADFIGGQEIQHHQLQYLLTQLSSYTYIGVGRDDGKQAGEYSCIFYKKERFDLLQEGTFWLSQTPDTVSKGWDAACNRVCTYGLFTERSTGKKCWVFNTHLDHMGKTARLESAKLILSKIRTLNEKLSLPVILTGDLNCTIEDEPIRWISKDLNNSRQISKEPAYGPIATFNGFRFHEIPQNGIDYIFLSRSPQIKCLRYATITDSYDCKYPSDHFPVIATIELP